MPTRLFFMVPPFYHIATHLTIIAYICYNIKYLTIKGGSMKLWLYWWQLVEQLRPACARFRTFLWLAVCMAGLTVRGDQCLSLSFPKLVWNSFGSWIRTPRMDLCPSEQVTAIALRNVFPEFLEA